jgi:hypothetical protein
MSSCFGNICICSDDETRDNEMVKLVYQRWTMATSDVFVLKSIYDIPQESPDDRCVC